MSKKETEPWDKALSEDIRAAEALGISYGKYKALTYTSPSPQKNYPPQPPKKRKQRKYTDQQLFELWQQGLTDAEIGAIVGVSRAMIQKWRDNMEIPSTKKIKTDPKNYQLKTTKYGLFVVYDDSVK